MRQARFPPEHLAFGKVIRIDSFGWQSYCSAYHPLASDRDCSWYGSIVRGPSGWSERDKSRIVDETMLKENFVELAVRQRYGNVSSCGEERTRRGRRCGFQVVSEGDEPSSGVVPVDWEEGHVELSLEVRVLSRLQYTPWR